MESVPYYMMYLVSISFMFCLVLTFIGGVYRDFYCDKTDLTINYVGLFVFLFIHLF